MRHILIVLLPLVLLFSLSSYTSSPPVHEPTTKDLCPDLIIDSIFVKDRTKRNLIIGYRVVNKGTGKAILMGHKKDEYKNVGVRAYFSGDDKFNPGDVFAKGSYIHEGVKNGKDILEPNESITCEITLKLKRKTSFNRFLVIKVDAAEAIHECDETNNTHSLVLDKKKRR